MCLVCTTPNRPKWVNDDGSHEGTFDAPSGSKGHQRNLRNCDVESVRRVRLIYHPEALTWERPVAQRPLPPPWQEHWDPCTKRNYFHNPVSKESTWERPVAQRPLPPPWQEHWDPHTKQNYFHNPDSKESTWERPEVAEDDDGVEVF